MQYTVAKAFSSASRRFAIGQQIDGSEVDGAIPVSRWVELGYLVGPGIVVPAPVPVEEIVRVTTETTVTTETETVPEPADVTA